MTIRNLAVARFVFVALTVAALALVPMTSAVAETGVSVKDGTEFLNEGDGSPIQEVPSCAR